MRLLLCHIKALYSRLLLLMTVTVLCSVSTATTPIDFFWDHYSVVSDQPYRVLNVGVSDYQSTTIGFPAIAYVESPNSTITPAPYTYAVRAAIGSTVTTIRTYTHTLTPTTSVPNIVVISAPSITLHSDGSAYAAWVELRSTATAEWLNIVYYSSSNAGVTWSGPTSLVTTGNLVGYQFDIGRMDVQIYDDTHWVWGGTWWKQETSTSDMVYDYRLKIKDGGSAYDILYKHGSYTPADESDTPVLFGVVPFTYKAGTSSTNPSTVVYNRSSSNTYDSIGSPIALRLTASKIADSTLTHEMISSTYQEFFALVSTQADNRHVVYSASATGAIMCATSASSGSWSTHSVTIGGLGVSGEIVAASADPVSSSDAFDVFCWTPDSSDPSVAWVLRHSSGTSYSEDTVAEDTSGYLTEPSQSIRGKAIGTAAEGLNVVNLYTLDGFQELATN